MSGSAAHAEPAETVTLTLPNMPLHDPWILANDSDKTYYLYTSNLPSISGVQGAGTMVYRSRDLKHWKRPVVAFTASAPLVYQDSGHGMLFHAFDGSLMLVLHRPFRNARGKLYEMKDAGDHLEVVRERTDLDTP